MRKLCKQFSGIITVFLALCLTVALFPAAAFAVDKTLTLTENWYLTSDLDLNVDAGDTLIIDGGNQFNIYEVDGHLMNTGEGTVVFMDMLVYSQGDEPTAGSVAEEKTIAANAVADTVTAITAPAKGAASLILPTVPGYKVSIKSTSNPDVIGLDGAIKPQQSATPVTLELIVTGDGAAAYTDKITVTVPGTSNTNPDNSNNGGGGGSGGGGSGGGGTPAPAANAALSLSTASFNKSEGLDISVTLTNNGYTLSAVKNGTYTLVRGTDYTVSGNIITIIKEYLATLDAGTATITFDMSGGTDPKLTVTVTGETTSDPSVGDGGDSDGGLFGDSDGPEPITPTMPVNPFTDVMGTDWFIDDVIYVYDNGLMSGTSSEPMLFSPDGTTTRGMIVTILYRYAGAPDVGDIENSFSDVAADQWYADAVMWASENGIVTGIGGELFSPDASVTRQDLAVILSRYMEYAGINPTLTQEYVAFSDEAEIAEYAKSAIQTLNKLGIINGVGNGAIDPAGNATRAQVAAMLHRFSAIEY